MPDDVYRTAAALPTPSEREARYGGDTFVVPVLLLMVGVLLSTVGALGGREHGTEGALGVLFLLLAVRCFVDARRARAAARIDEAAR